METTPARSDPTRTGPSAGTPGAVRAGVSDRGLSARQTRATQLRPRGTDDATRPPAGPSTIDDLPLMLTVAEAAVVLRVSRTTAYKLADDWRTSNGREGLPVIKLGRRLVVRRVDLAELVGLPATG